MQIPIFYPPPPEEPRLQFLKSFSGDKDLGGGPSGFVLFIVGKTPPSKLIGKPYGIALRDGKLYVCDSGATAIDVMDLRKREFRYFMPRGEGELRTPINIAVDHDGTRYVTDTARGQVLIYAADDTYSGAIGERAKGAARAHAKKPATQAESEMVTGPAMRPTDVAIWGDRLYVADLQNHCVRVYDKVDRHQLFTIPADPAADDPGKLIGPTNLTLDAQGRLYVSDMAAFRVQQYEPDGKFLRSVGRPGDSPGEFARPKGIAVDRDGRLYVVDAAAQVIQIFNPEGELLLFFGEPDASDAALDLPAKVAIDYDHVELFQKYADPDFQLEHLVLVSNQYGDRKVSVYGFGHKK